jgi:hypothetical protein
MAHRLDAGLIERQAVAQRGAQPASRREVLPVGG